jgi:hypothetical protein
VNQNVGCWRMGEWASGGRGPPCRLIVKQAPEGAIQISVWCVAYVGALPNKGDDDNNDGEIVSKATDGMACPRHH